MYNETLFISGVAGFFATLIWRLTNNCKRIKENGKTINHKHENFIRTAALFMPAMLLGLVSHPNWWSLLGAICIVTPMFAAWWLLLFDGSLGLCRGRGWWDLGSDDVSEDAMTDDFLRSLPLWKHITIKIGAVIITTLGYVLWIYL